MAAAADSYNRLHEAEIWVDPISRAEPSQTEPRQKGNSRDPGVPPKGVIPSSPSLPIFLVSQFDSLLSLDGLTVVRLKGTKNTGYAWLSPGMAE